MACIYAIFRRLLILCIVSASLHNALAYNNIIEGYAAVAPIDSTPPPTIPTPDSPPASPTPAPASPTSTLASPTPTPTSPTSTLASSIPAPSPSTSPISTENRVIVGYYPDWRTAQLAVNNLFWDKITHVNYAFALMDDSVRPVIKTGPNLSTLVWYAHTYNVKVLLTIGGWSGSKTFSSMVASPESRAVFINATMSLINQYNLDGVDIDWEYPGRKGAICNVVNPQSDTSNFLSLLKELRAAVGNKLLTIAVRAETLDGPNGPVTDVSGFASVVDWVNIMAYDMAVDDHSNEPWTKITGPNAPFNVTPGQGRQLSFTQSANTWLKSGMPASKIVMGVEFVGRALTATDQMSDSQYVGRDSVVPKGDQSDALWAEPCPGASQVYSGVWSWKNLRQQGLLECTMSAAKNTPWTRHFDNVTNTPWLFNSETKTYISYDDPQSLYIKSEYVKSQNLRGIMIWDLTTDNGKELLSAVQSLKQPSSAAAPTNDCSASAAYNPNGAPAADSSGGGTSGNESPKPKKIGVGTAVGITFLLAAFAALCVFGYIWNRRKRATVLANESASASSSALVGVDMGIQYKDCVIALFDFKAVRKNDLSFKKGDIIEVLEKGSEENSWWVGRLNGEIGEFPGNYVKDEF